MEQKERLALQLFAEGVQEAEAPAQTEGPPEEPQESPQGDGREQQLQRFASHLQSLERQAEALKGTFPAMDLRQELKNPVFARLTAPGMGLSVEDAYYAVHRREIQAAAMAAAQKQVSNAIASGAMRPRENGLNGQAAAISSFDYRSASREQREELKKRIRLAAAEGRKLYPQG